MGFIWLIEIKDDKEIDLCLNLDHITRIYKKKSDNNVQYYQIYLQGESGNHMIKDLNNHLTNTLFKNKAKE